MIEYYAAVRFTHLACVVTSLSLFALRGVLMLAESPLRSHVVLRIAPHAVDTLLLASALMLSYMLQQYPFVHAWLTAKVLALIGYIVLGSIALKRGRTRRTRAVAFVAALACAGYIVSVALARTPFGILQGWLATG